MQKRKNTPPSSTDTDDRILSTKELLERIPLNRITLWRMSREGRFPRPIQLTRARIGWRWSAVLAWLTERERHPIASRDYFKPTDSNSAA